MIQVEKLSYGFPDKDLYKDISFTLAAGQHCALIGSNGCGKSGSSAAYNDDIKGLRPDFWHRRFGQSRRYSRQRQALQKFATRCHIFLLLSQSLTTPATSTGLMTSSLW